MENLNEIIANNIVMYRKACKMTQLDLAEKLNFSDKSISKWERGESIPDINVLYSLCKLFNITLNDLVKKHERKIKLKEYMANKLVVSLLSAGLTWLVATVIYVCLFMFAPKLENTYLAFIYAIPVFFIVLLVFSCVYKTKLVKYVLTSIVIWTCVLPISLTFNGTAWYLLIICVPLQVLTVLWYFRKRKNKM